MLSLECKIYWMVKTQALYLRCSIIRLTNNVSCLEQACHLKVQMIIAQLLNIVLLS